MESFSIGEYIEENEGNLTVMKHLPKTRAEDAKGGSYTIDFPEISRALREKNNWKCSKCEVNMLEKKSGLHVHHINGVKSDNNHKNLMVLCALCHQGIDSFHSTMHVNQSIRSFIEQNRER